MTEKLCEIIRLIAEYYEIKPFGVYYSIEFGATGISMAISEEDTNDFVIHTIKATEEDLDAFINHINFEIYRAKKECNH